MMTTRRLLGLCAAFALTGAACRGRSEDDRVARYAAKRLGVEPGSLRVTSQSDLDGARHRFELVTRDGVPALVVVVPSSGKLFDSRTNDAFDRVARDENAVENLSRLGAERVALWFASLGGGRCPPPSSSAAHFATTTSTPSGVELSYPAGTDRKSGITRTCVIDLAPDGTLREARVETDQAPQARARGWGAVRN